MRNLGTKTLQPRARAESQNSEWLVRIGVVPHSSTTLRIERYVSKNAARALVRRLLAVYESKHVIRMVEPRLMPKALPYRQQITAKATVSYQHHIEPHIEKLTISNSAWLRYLQGVSISPQGVVIQPERESARATAP